MKFNNKNINRSRQTLAQIATHHANSLNILITLQKQIKYHYNRNGYLIDLNEKNYYNGNSDNSHVNYMIYFKNNRLVFDVYRDSLNKTKIDKKIYILLFNFCKFLYQNAV